jgi:hypothetical protein
VGQQLLEIVFMLQYKIIRYKSGQQIYPMRVCVYLVVGLTDQS